jgi:hypothetical protein
VRESHTNKTVTYFFIIGLNNLYTLIIDAKKYHIRLKFNPRLCAADRRELGTKFDQSVTTPACAQRTAHFLPALHKSQIPAFNLQLSHQPRGESLIITCAELFLSQMSSDLLKEHLKAVADRLTDKSTRNAKVLKPSKKSDSIKKTERANNYIGWFYFLT